MILQLIFKSAKADKSTLNYMSVQCDSWSIVGELLAVQQSDIVRYYPLINIESFSEVL